LVKEADSGIKSDSQKLAVREKGVAEVGSMGRLPCDYTLPSSSDLKWTLDTSYDNWCK